MYRPPLPRERGGAAHQRRRSENRGEVEGVVGRYPYMSTRGSSWWCGVRIETVRIIAAEQSSWTSSHGHPGRIEHLRPPGHVPASSFGVTIKESKIIVSQSGAGRMKRGAPVHTGGSVHRLNHSMNHEIPATTAATRAMRIHGGHTKPFLLCTINHPLGVLYQLHPVHDSGKYVL